MSAIRSYFRTTITISKFDSLSCFRSKAKKKYINKQTNKIVRSIEVDYRYIDNLLRIKDASLYLRIGPLILRNLDSQRSQD